MNELTVITPHEQRPVDNYRMSTDAASVCHDIVVATASTIQGRKFVSVEGWQAIAIAHGCAAGARDVERVDGGVRAIGEVRRMSDGQVIATAEGFVGEDEPTWFGGNSRGKTLPKRADYAIRAMAQTRAVSRACRSAFAHVVVMMKAGLSTTPAEEVPAGGFDDVPHNPQTGEIIDAAHIPVQEPAAREKLDGPHTSKTALRKAVNEVIAAVRKAETVEAIDALKVEHRRTINQARRDWPTLIDGDPNIEEDLGLKGEIDKRRKEVARSDLYRDLIESLNQCDTADDMASLIDMRADSIADLDGEESRRFTTLYDERHSILKSGKVPLIPAEAK